MYTHNEYTHLTSSSLSFPPFLPSLPRSLSFLSSLPLFLPPSPYPSSLPLPFLPPPTLPPSPYPSSLPPTLTLQLWVQSLGPLNAVPLLQLILSVPTFITSLHQYVHHHQVLLHQLFLLLLNLTEVKTIIISFIFLPLLSPECFPLRWWQLALILLAVLILIGIIILAVIKICFILAVRSNKNLVANRIKFEPLSHF